MTDLPSILRGNQFDVFRETDTPGQFAFFCVATSQSLEHSIQYDESNERDCSDRSALAQNVRTPKGQMMKGTISGRCSAKHHSYLRADMAAAAAGNPRKYQFIIDDTGANGGGTYTGPLQFDALSISKQDNGQVTFNASGQFQGMPVWADAI